MTTYEDYIKEKILYRIPVDTPEEMRKHLGECIEIICPECEFEEEWFGSRILFNNSMIDSLRKNDTRRVKIVGINQDYDNGKRIGYICQFPGSYNSRRTIIPKRITKYEHSLALFI